MFGDSLTRLPFDQYQRYRLAREILTRVFPSEEPLTVLDVGGADGLLARFLPHWQFTVLDPGELIPPSRLVRGSGSAIPFRDEAFDLVVNVDTLEHLDPTDRPSLIREMIRTSRQGGLVAAPFRKPEVERAEKAVADLHRKITRHHHPFLEEHRRLGLPELRPVVEILGKEGLQVGLVPNGYLPHWLAGMLTVETLEHCPDSRDLVEGIHHFFNHRLYTGDNREPAYRRFVVFARTGLPEALAPPGNLAPPDREEMEQLLQGMAAVGRAYRKLERHSRKVEKIHHQEEERHRTEIGDARIALEEANQELESRETSRRRAAEAARDHEKALQQASAHRIELEQQIAELREALDRARQAYENTRDELEPVQRRADELEQTARAAVELADAREVRALELEARALEDQAQNRGLEGQIKKLERHQGKQEELIQDLRKETRTLEKRQLELEKLAADQEAEIRRATEHQTRQAAALEEQRRASTTELDAHRQRVQELETILTEKEQAFAELERHQAEVTREAQDRKLALEKVAERLAQIEKEAQDRAEVIQAVEGRAAELEEAVQRAEALATDRRTALDESAQYARTVEAELATQQGIVEELGRQLGDLQERKGKVETELDSLRPYAEKLVEELRAKVAHTREIEEYVRRLEEERRKRMEPDA